ncbi:MAG: hypothetical protein M3R02_05200 [Chloroflexota bacterium]|nr:hypothetical protein [Chloroflexota bacterium]
MPKKKRHVSVVTAGSYSDYRILAVFDDDKLADAYVKAYNETYPYDAADAERWHLNPMEKQIRAGRFLYSVSIDRDGENASATLVDEENLPPSSRWPVLESYRLYNGPTRSRGAFIIEATDAQHAIKIANERRTQMIALNAWPEP